MGMNWAMYDQLGLEVVSKSQEHSQIAFDLHEFWSEELHYEKWSKKKKHWCVDFIISLIPWMRAMTSWGWCTTKLLQDPIVASFNFYIELKFREKWFFQLCPNLPSFAKIPQEILDIE